MKSPTPSEPIVDWGCSCGATINQEGVQQRYYCDKHKPQTDDHSLTPNEPTYDEARTKLVNDSFFDLIGDPTTPNEQAGTGYDACGNHSCLWCYPGTKVDSYIPSTSDQANTTPQRELAQETTPSKADEGLGAEIVDILLKYTEAKGIDFGTALKDSWPLFTEPMLRLITTTLTQCKDEVLAQLPKKYTEKQLSAMINYSHAKALQHNRTIDQVTAIIKRKDT